MRYDGRRIKSIKGGVDIGGKSQYRSPFRVNDA